VSDCAFCDLDGFRRDSVVLLENELALFGNLEDGDVLLRFADEPRAGYGIRWWLRQPENRRPDPAAPGTGRRDFKVSYDAR
jgi:hypothetical protein